MFKAGDRVKKVGTVRRGTVSWTRGEFVHVRWDIGKPTDEWGAELQPLD